MRILAIDIGVQTCGYVICEVENLKVDLIKEGEIKPQNEISLAKKLNFIFTELKNEIKKYCIEALIVEKLYSHYRHPTTLGLLAQVRGVLALLSERAGIKFFEYSPTRARKSLLGKGNANSERVKKMAENITGRVFKSLHTADAFSLAIAFSHDQKLKGILRDSI